MSFYIQPSQRERGQKCTKFSVWMHVDGMNIDVYTCMYYMHVCVCLYVCMCVCAFCSLCPDVHG